MLPRALIYHCRRKSQKCIPKQMFKASALLCVPQARSGPLCLLEFLQARKQLGPTSVLPSAPSPFGRERIGLVNRLISF